MLEFTHRSTENEKSLHIWHFVYFHGEAERMNDKAFADGGDAPDISIANEPIENYLPMFSKRDRHEALTFGADPSAVMVLGVQVAALPCTAGGKPAVVVLATRPQSLHSFRMGRTIHGPIGGRIALVSDVEAMRHAYDVANWH